MNQDFFATNRQRVFEQMEDNAILVLFSGRAPQKSADELYPFTPNRNFYYLTGIEKTNIIVVMTKIKGIKKEMVFVEAADPKLEKWVGKKMTQQEASSISGIAEAHYVDAFKSKLSNLLESSEIKSIYLNLERLEWEDLDTESHRFAREIAAKHPYLKIKNVYHKIESLRTIKSKEEIDRLKEAIRVTDKGIQNILRNAKPGMREYELGAHFDFTLTASGIKDHAFHSIIASGANGAILHYNDNDSEVMDGSLVLLDLGAQYGYYNADISRTFPANGRFNDRQKTIYNIVLKALEETIKIIKPGVPYIALNKRAKEVLLEGCQKLGLVQTEEELGKYYYHGVSHYLGLDTHDVGDRSATLEAGMVLTVEPGLYIEEESIGIRIEDDVLVTEEGCINLSQDIIRTVEEIEAFMNNK